MQRVAVNADQLADELADFLRLAIRPGQDEALRVAAQLDLSMSQLRVLFLLEGGERDFAVHELAAGIGLSVGATSRAVDCLVRGGLVSRREDPVDRRLKRIAITAKGKRALVGLAAAKRAGLRRFTAELGDAEREQMSRALAPVLARAAASSPRPGRSA
jgi:DNA-binding MarR family transcriptional regulator